MPSASSDLKTWVSLYTVVLVVLTIGEISVLPNFNTMFRPDEQGPNRSITLFSFDAVFFYLVIVSSELK